MNPAKPETLTELLKTLERSGDLRSLARECGLSVRELRRRLSIWRRELADESEAGDQLSDPAFDRRSDQRSDHSPTGGTASAGVKPASRRKGDDEKFPVLLRARDLVHSPLPDEGRPVMEIHTDGASRGNPGPAAIGIVFGLKGGPLLAEHGEAIGKATNNVAEYRAIVTALEHCQRWGVRRVDLKMDSELIVRQLHGAYRVKSPDLRPHYQQVMFLSKGLDEFRVAHVKRAQNAHADAVANRALDQA
jgi:ribonuclease HI